MVLLHQVRVQWSGIKGLPGVTTFYTEQAVAPFLTKVSTFFTAIKAQVPSGVVWTMPTSGIDVDSGTGNAVATWATGSPTTITATGSGNVHAAGGAVINWKTGLFLNGRQLRGKTFIVPLVSACYAADGSLDDLWRSNLEGYANTLGTGTNGISVWSRKTGQVGGVTSASVPDKAVVLTSRRD